MDKILLTGASGLVGSRLTDLLSAKYALRTPSQKELNVVNQAKVNAYCVRYKPEVIIHAAAFTDINAAENERGDTKGACWRVNIEGTRHVAHAAEKMGVYMIYLSTGSVFRGTENNPGPFHETDSATPQSKVSWYGWTKSQAEKFVTGAVVRIAHPVKRGEPDTEDYVHKIVSLYDRNMLFDLYTDQHIQLTYIDDIYQTIEKLITKRLRGVFHVTSPDTVTPYTLTKKILELTGRNRTPLKKGTIVKIMQSSHQPLLYHQYCALDVVESQKRLGMRFTPWKKTITNLFEE